MSWQSYVDSNLVGTGKVSKAAIFGLDGSLWATSPDFNVGGDEVNKLVAAFIDEAGIAANGLHLEGAKYVLLRKPDVNTIYARNGATGVCCVKTGQAVIVGFYNETVQAGDCNTVVENLAVYLRGAGY
ncbi:profilin, required for normal timing of actin polymerization in response to thermal stress [Mortierella antarctica]|nr:profilin, required for normal timing of actin polymerization in response to thermal stress [Mortierella antarctica]